MDFNIQKLDKKHPNYADPISARWYCEANGVEYFHRTEEGLRECVMRMTEIQKNGPKKPEPRRGSAAGPGDKGKKPADSKPETEDNAEDVEETDEDVDTEVDDSDIDNSGDDDDSGDDIDS